MPIVPNRGSTINRNNTGPQANVPGLHTPRGALTTVAGAQTISDSATYTGNLYTGALTITGNPTFRDCQFTNRITLDTRGLANITGRSATFEWCLFGDPTNAVSGTDPNPGFIRGNVTCYRCRSCMYNDHFQIDAGYVRITQHMFDGLYKGDTFTFNGSTTTGTGVAHNDFLQFHYISANNDADNTTIQEIIVQESFFNCWSINTGDITGENDGETGTIPSSRRATSAFGISNPGASGGVDTRRRNQSTWMVFRDNHYVGVSDRVLHVTARSAVGADRQVAVIDNIIEGDSQSGHSQWFSFFNASGATGANPRVFFGRNQNNTGATIALPTNAEAAGAATDYPRIATYDNVVAPPAIARAATRPSTARPTLGSYTDNAGDAITGLTADLQRGIGPISLPANRVVEIDRFYFWGDGNGSGAGSGGGLALWSLTSGDAATALPSSGGGNRGVGNITTTNGRAVASIRKNANGTMGWHTAYRASADALAQGVAYSGTVQFDAAPATGEQWIAFYLSTTAAETSEFGQSGNTNSLGLLVGYHDDSVWLIRKNSDGTQTQIATSTTHTPSLTTATDYAWSFTMDATNVTVTFGSVTLTGAHGLSWTSATWYMQFQNSDTVTTFQTSFATVTATTIAGGTTGSTQPWRGIVYADNGAGLPGDVLGQSSEGTITAQDPVDSIYYSPALDLQVDSSVYPSIHLYLMTGATSNVGQIRRLANDTTYTFGFGDLTYASGASDDPTVATTTDALPRFWVEYQTLGRRRFASGRREFTSGRRGTGTRGTGTRA